MCTNLRDRMNAMPLHRRRDNPALIICCLVALTLVLCGRSKRLTTASASADETSKIANFLSSLYGKAPNADKSDGTSRTIQLSAGQLSAFLNQFQRPQNQGLQNSQKPSEDQHGHKKDRLKGKLNRRKVLYDLSVQAHYERFLHEAESRNSSSSPHDDSSLHDYVPSCEYYNDGMQSKFDLRKMANEASIFTRCSHWTYKLCPRKSISQIHMEPSPITESEDPPNPQILKLPSSSLLSNSIQFTLPQIIDLGTYLPSSTPDYYSLIEDAWGPGEMKWSALHRRIEYYVGGDICKGPGFSRKRHSKVIYAEQCCVRRQSMIEEFFHSHGKIMIQSTTEPETCKYIFKVCEICPTNEVGGNETLEAATETPPTVELSDFGHLLQTLLQYPPSEALNSVGGAFPPMPPSLIEANKQLLQSMFTHAYDSYFYNAFPASELRPLTCQPGEFDLVKVPALTLIDTLDTFVIMGNYTEFARSVERLRYLDERMKCDFRGDSNDENRYRDGEEGGLFGVNQNVSVFETTIRLLGGLLSAHQMAIAFVGNVVSKLDVWDSSGAIRSGDFIGSIVHDDRVESKKDDENFMSFIYGESGDHNSESNSCPWDQSPYRTAEPVVMNVEKGQECDSDIGAPNEKKEGKKPSSVTSRNGSSSWQYDGFLLKLAHDIGKRLLFAFDTETGIPYGTINLLHGIPPGETPVASLAGAGTLSLEFELLSRLTGDQSFGRAAKLATRALWIRRSPDLNLLGKHIDSRSGKWKESLSGIGSNSDSFYEYLLKHYLLFPDDTEFWTMFLSVYSGVHENSRLGEWYVDVDLGHGLSGHVRQVFESLMAFYPGLQVLLGELVPSAKTLSSFFLVREFLGLLPERFNFAHWKIEGSGDVHPLRPELLESCYFLHLASIGHHGSKCGPCSNISSSTHTSSWLWAANFALHAVHKLSWTPCGFATVTQVGERTGGLNSVRDNADPQMEQERLNIQHHNEMPSYFLSETIKYLYLTFDSDNSVIHQDETNDWIFTTEAHPIHYVPVSNSTMQGSERLKVQLDQVRSLLKERISNSPPLVDEAYSVNASGAHFEQEQWSPKTPESIFVTNLQNLERDIIAGKQEITGVHDFKSGPPFERILFSPAQMSSYGIFSSEISSVNQAHAHFASHGKGSGNGLGKRCPNYHHPDLQWTHALHDDLDYNSRHSSSVGNVISSNNGVDERMTTAIASVCFYGTDYYPDGIHVDMSKSCSVEDAPEYGRNSQPTTIMNKKLQQSTSTPIPGSTRYDMGGIIGAFDVSAFPGGDGFVVRHVDSNELLEVSIFRDDPPSPDVNAETIFFVVLTMPPPLKLLESHSTKAHASSFLSSRRSSGWNWRHYMGSGVGDSPEEDGKPKLVNDDYRRHVVVADIETNSFKCEIVITKKINSEKRNHATYNLLANFPCSPGFFGKANIPNLRKSGGEIIKGSVSPPPTDDEFGCKPPDGANLLDQGKYCNANHVNAESESVLQMVRRGNCNFMRKTANHHHAKGIIVINSNPSELFVMAGEKSQPGSDCSSDNLPVTVMVSGQDGESIIQLLRDEESKGNVIHAEILLTKEAGHLIEFPYVKGSSEALKILASNGWGIHAVPQPQIEQNGWQLFIIHHDQKV